MTNYIALFRGINVGGRNRLAMKDLVSILEGLGYENIRTYIQSGNVVLESEKPCSDQDSGKISDAIEAEVGFRPNVLLLSAEDLRAALAGNPFPTSEGKTLHFSFLETEPLAPDLDTLAQLKSETEQFKLDGKVFYLHAPDGIGRSKLAEKVERCLGVSATGRNLNTVNAILKML